MIFEKELNDVLNFLVWLLDSFYFSRVSIFRPEFICDLAKGGLLFGERDFAADEVLVLRQALLLHGLARRFFARGRGVSEEAKKRKRKQERRT